jgi:hypothetical protein
MAINSQKGVYGFGPQSEKGTVASTFYRHKASDVDLGIQDDTRLGPAEVGGSPVPSFAYKAGYVPAGGASIFPRLEDTFGWLAYGILGSVTTTTGDGVGENPPVGVNRHKFHFATDEGYVPWMSARKLIPGGVGVDALGETYLDMKMIGFGLNLVNDAPPSVRVDMLGRDFALADPTGWSWGNTYETFESIPVGAAVGGFFKVPSFSADELPLVGAAIAIQNAPQDIRQEKVYGSPQLEDVTIVQRQVTIDAMVKWSDPTLYRSILTGSGSGTAWTASPWTSDFDVLAVTPGNISGFSVPYKLRMQAATVVWQVNGGIRLAGNQSLMMRLQGTVIEPSSGDFASLTLDNEVAAYSWPTP